MDINLLKEKIINLDKLLLENKTSEFILEIESLPEDENNYLINRFHNNFISMKNFNIFYIKNKDIVDYIFNIKNISENNFFKLLINNELNFLNSYIKDKNIKFSSRFFSELVDKFCILDKDEKNNICKLLCKFYDLNANNFVFLNNLMLFDKENVELFLNKNNVYFINNNIDLFKNIKSFIINDFKNFDVLEKRGVVFNDDFINILADNYFQLKFDKNDFCMNLVFSKIKNKESFLTFANNNNQKMLELYEDYLLKNKLILEIDKEINNNLKKVTKRKI